MGKRDGEISLKKVVQQLNEKGFKSVDVLYKAVELGVMV